MQIEISRGYRRNLRRIRDAELRGRIDDAIAKIEAAESVDQIRGAERVRHPRIPYYRLRIGDYRLIFYPVGADTAIIERFGHRNDVYQNLPG